ncbi:hypothetical protein ACXIU6_10840 [Vibrio parahaemolyticus]|uniref:hypothetical protein n=1 Tax=Vibrio parahaemolyticus TaxID=670 RepID=UPI001112D6CD|nr:hypothetical protein [Vibrio parahaemolyticus]MBE4203301.1 hypothetical protein [Vibrio parahaemolyticus]
MKHNQIVGLGVIKKPFFCQGCTFRCNLFAIQSFALSMNDKKTNALPLGARPKGGSVLKTEIAYSAT